MLLTDGGCEATSWFHPISWYGAHHALAWQQCKMAVNNKNLRPEPLESGSHIHNPLLYDTLYRSIIHLRPGRASGLFLLCLST
jgi:hypothetical protein